MLVIINEVSKTMTPCLLGKLCVLQRNLSTATASNFSLAAIFLVAIYEAADSCGGAVNLMSSIFLNDISCVCRNIAIISWHLHLLSLYRQTVNGPITSLSIRKWCTWLHVFFLFLPGILSSTFFKIRFLLFFNDLQLLIISLFLYCSRRLTLQITSIKSVNCISILLSSSCSSFSCFFSSQEYLGDLTWLWLTHF